MRHCLLLAAMLLPLACVTRAEAGRVFCRHCGCWQNCKKVCHVKCETKKETKTEYVCECEDFCVPGPSKKCGVKIERDCLGRHRTIIWQPRCARVHTKKKLVKKEVTKEVPDYKWEVEEYCCVCGHWVKVVRDKDKEKDKDKDEKDKEDGQEESGKSSGKKEKSKSSDSDCPNKAGSSHDGADRDGGKSHIERLPAPPAERADKQALWNLPAADDRAADLDAESNARLNLSALSEAGANAPKPAAPRRLFSGLFGR